MVEFESLLSRADVALLQELLGESVVRIVCALNPEKASAPQLKKTLISQISPIELLFKLNSRNKLLELLRPNEASDLCTHLGINDNDNPFAALGNLQVRRTSQQAILLLSFFGIAAPDNEIIKPECLSIVAGGYSLFPHQKKVVREATRFLEIPPYKVLIHMPTGSGKTRTAMNIIADHLRHSDTGLVLWLATSEELCDQATDEFTLAWSKLGDRPLNVYRWWGSATLPLKVPNSGFAVAGLSKIYSQCIKNIPWQARLGDKISLIVFDEAHQAIAPTYRYIVETIRARRPDSALIGLSATPGRTWNDPVADEELAAFFAKQKVILHIDGYANPMEYLIAERYLANPLFRK